MSRKLLAALTLLLAAGCSDLAPPDGPALDVTGTWRGSKPTPASALADDTTTSDSIHHTLRVRDNDGFVYGVLEVAGDTALPSDPWQSFVTGDHFDGMMLVEYYDPNGGRCRLWGEIDAERYEAEERCEEDDWAVVALHILLRDTTSVAGLTASIAPAADTVEVGDTAQFTLEITGGDSEVDPAWMCVSSDTTVASAFVTSSGCSAMALDTGTTTIAATVTRGMLMATATASLRVVRIGPRQCPLGSPTWMGLPVCEEGVREGYDRDAFGRGYSSLEDEIIAGLPKSGGQVYTPYTCTLYDIREDGTAATDIDHIVALAEAYDSGLDSTRFRTFGGDSVNLTVAVPSLNRNQKSDKDAAEWKPAQNVGWYAGKILEVKQKYGLSVNPAERDSLVAWLAADTSRVVTCPASG